MVFVVKLQLQLQKKKKLLHFYYNKTVLNDLFANLIRFSGSPNWLKGPVVVAIGLLNQKCENQLFSKNVGLFVNLQESYRWL